VRVPDRIDVLAFGCLLRRIPPTQINCNTLLYGVGTASPHSAYGGFKVYSLHYVEGEFSRDFAFIGFSEVPKPRSITTTVLWLRGFDLDISCVRITPHRLRDKIVLVSEKIIPLKESEQYLTGVQEKEEKRQESKKRNPPTIPTLLKYGLLKEGDKISLTSRLPSYVEYAEDNPVYHATITGNPSQQNAVRWDKDGQEYSLSGLTRRIFTGLHPDKSRPKTVSGPDHWTTEDGVPLYDLARSFWENSGEEG
jgi:hypothetical protein